MGKLQCSKTFQLAYIDVPKAFRFPDQTRPGSDLLPSLQAQTNGIVVRRRFHTVRVAAAVEGSAKNP
ncbi:hypothetical protein [Synechococcus sp. PROS-7-1]|uniref:hypothetical protein n=1 Tax=Synechococcus sp. PROS-7-1 TaxID=1442556 RepID=UPI00164875BE|nr:hypothetical protein [Synechococcus sp. PROS-7-1]